MPRKKTTPKTKKITGPPEAADFDAVNGRVIKSGLPPEPVAAGQFLRDPQTREVLQRRDQAAKRWMMLGVTTMAIVIIGLWGWSIKTKISEISWKQSAENQLAIKTKENWDNAFKDSPTDNDALNKAKAQLQTILGAIAASSTPTTTPVQIATTTPSATTTPATTTIKKKK